jgi:ABC-type uncharacterized transport system permease subunit
MKKILFCLLILTSSMPASAATAFWTGRSEQVQTVTYQMAWNCEYNYAGQIFWKVFVGSCPNSIEVQ